MNFQRIRTCTCIARRQPLRLYFCQGALDPLSHSSGSTQAKNEIMRSLRVVIERLLKGASVLNLYIGGS